MDDKKPPARRSAFAQPAASTGRSTLNRAGFEAVIRRIVRGAAPGQATSESWLSRHVSRLAQKSSEPNETSAPPPVVEECKRADLIRELLREWPTIAEDLSHPDRYPDLVAARLPLRRWDRLAVIAAGIKYGRMKLPTEGSETSASINPNDPFGLAAQRGE